ncbi:Coenzyme F420 hydrogenase/dehydrogenase, beta subunit C-terminal domain [Nocardioides sp. zg-ZUI104]|uniref:Coenzyme F420 hydrogenase/dehydrogenase, beta subunit C-terminal domain n=1 Tax=Nocardioides faecalis TaxID=2803858 RepID=UPI001BCB796C|nr:Coenzyme F420 hydrogenase/dehydrogenase, beta subunit C-terminal domain [Nocardioides faecalis]MBS4753324.1 Coenzyme F420 hydrogenase/dehydrogenase, beta subunit C-terminal domain [Nocardioides faecalis]
MVHRIEEVVARGMCVGCGGCGAATGGAIPVTIGKHGVYQASLEGVGEADRRVGSKVCPFSDEALNEDTLGAPRPDSSMRTDSRVGAYSNILAGRRTDDEALPKSSSGGLTSWTLQRLIETGKVDGVIHVGGTDGAGELFEYVVSESVDEVESRRKSQYYSTSMHKALLSVRGNGRRYAIVGVPCFISAARRVAVEDEVLRQQLAYFVGIVCGHLKSQFFPEAAAWQLGVTPGGIATVDFRGKHPDRPAWDYDFRVITSSGDEKRGRNLDLLGSNWGHGALQPEACNFCDDIFAETADVVFGDAWIDRYQADWRGTNVVVSRNVEIDDLLAQGARDGVVELDEISVDDAAASQAGNFRHRRDGLAVRLADDIAKGLSVPAKRVDPDRSVVPLHRRLLVRQRRRMSRRSLETFRAARNSVDLDKYLRPMSREIFRYKLIDKLGKRLSRR